MFDLNRKALALLFAAFASTLAAAADRVASVAEPPSSAEAGPDGDHGMLVDRNHALVKATNSSASIVLRPFARSLQEAAAGPADFHIPFVQNGNHRAG